MGKDGWTSDKNGDWHFKRPSYHTPWENELKAEQRAEQQREDQLKAEQQREDRQLALRNFRLRSPLHQRNFVCVRKRFRGTLQWNAAY